MSADTQPTDLLLFGLDGANPLAFLAALGTLRTLTLAIPDHTVRMDWIQHGTGWRPRLHSSPPIGDSDVLDALTARLESMQDHPALTWNDDIRATPDECRELVLEAQASAGPCDRTAADFLAAFASECVLDRGGEEVQDTALRTMRGSGHQHFLKTMRNLVAACSRDHLRRTLFEHWDYADPLKGLSLRWDPADDRRHALQWVDPSKDPTRRSAGSMLGANRLAVEAMPLLPVMPVGRHLETAGFRGRRASNTYFTWPIWTMPVGVEVLRSLLALRELQQDTPDRHGLLAMGIAEGYRAQRITQGKFRNFSPAQAV
jgi:hypothetical protein